MPEMTPEIAKLVRQHEALLRKHALTPPSLETLIRQRNERAAGSGTRLYLQGADGSASAGAERLAASGSVSKGMSGGKVTAIVAGIGLIGGGLYWLSHRQRDDGASWTDKIDAERMTQGPPAFNR